MKDRIKKIRKALGLSGEKFGENIGLKRSSISQLETGTNNPTDQVIKSICLAYNVNEDWLRTGNGEMFIETKDSFLDSISKQFNLEELDVKILESYIDLPPEKRQVIKDYLKSLNK
ncbi:helix-turn-helix domain-containing protein [Anaerococcus murdochii]|uniref:Helix-turn-helix domain-containing protein n=1 Tax=Anaerococcus murdochii TaxID=411577 RepID=A0ABS7T0J7_9FIRM|nr:helix-turn-helix transcriptional regulator [Anaerococcus murdochii]MBZ2387304.1 helix-turn-helix domain-containing protein [Anaerococcus murdochii]